MTLAEWADELIGKAPRLPTVQNLWQLGIESADFHGLYCEFGVGDGVSLRALSQMRPNVTFSGFDWFQGLPSDGKRSIWPKGQYTRNGVPPWLPDNVKLRVGLFENSLPEFLTETKLPAAFLHIDCDLYESTNTVLRSMRPRIVPGTVLLFDEFWGFEGWERGEARAFYEFQQTGSLAIECLGVYGEQALFRIKA